MGYLLKYENSPTVTPNIFAAFETSVRALIVLMQREVSEAKPADCLWT